MMRDRSLITSSILVVLAAALAAVVAVASSASAQEDSQADTDDWSPCQSPASGSPFQRIERAEIVLVMDRSQSLGGPDPGGSKRGDALKRIRADLTDLQGQLSDSSGDDAFVIDVALIAFNSSADTLAGLDQVGTDHPSDTAIDDAAENNRATDYEEAIKKALGIFDSSSHSDSETTCRIIVFFTDGVNDPSGTEGSNDPSKQTEAVSNFSTFLRDLCKTGGYRDRMNNLSVSTYVAVLPSNTFRLGEGTSHRHKLALLTKQAILGMTGHTESSLLDGVSAADGCEDWTTTRAGKVIELSDLDVLAIELENVVEDIEAALSRTSCRSGERIIAEFVDNEWPDFLEVRDSLSTGKLCTINAPLEGTTTVTLSGEFTPDDGTAADVKWLIDDGRTQERFRLLRAGDPPLSFNIVAEDLPPYDPFGGSSSNAEVDAEVKVILTWEPEIRQRGELQSEPTSVRFRVPSREDHWIKKAIICNISPRAEQVETDGVDQEQVRSLCEVAAPPTGEFIFTLEPKANKLSWSLALPAGEDNALERRNEIILESSDDPDDSKVQIAAVATRTNQDDLSEFKDTFTINLTWHSSRGSQLSVKSWDIGVRVWPRPPTELNCDRNAEATFAAMGDDSEDDMLVVDTGCTLPAPRDGAVTAQVVGALDGRTWELVSPTSIGTDWQEQNEVIVSAIDDGTPLFVGVKHTELTGLVGSDSEFTLLTTWSEDPTEEQTRRSVSIYLPVLQCGSRFADTETQLTESGPVAEAIDVCRIDAPPNGSLEVSSVATTGVRWQWASSEDLSAANDALSIPSGSGRTDVSAISKALEPELLLTSAPVNVKVTWTSQRGYESYDSASIDIVIPGIRPLLECTGTPELVTSGDVPDGPIVVDTGCVLLAPDAGTVDVSDIVGGGIAGFDGASWQLHGDYEIGPGDDPVPVLIETAEPLPNGNYDIDGEFDLATVWTSNDGTEYVATDLAAGRQSRDISVDLRARPDTGAAALITAALLLASVGAIWLILRTVGRRANRLRKPGAYRVVHQEVTATADPSGRLELPGFDAAAAVSQSGDRLDKSGSRLRAAGLTIRNTSRWWNPSDLLAGGRARAMPQGGHDLLIAVSPSSGEPDCLPLSPAHGTVVMALNPTLRSADAGRREFRGDVWILIDTKAKASTRQSAERTVQQNISKSLNDLRRPLGARPATEASARQKG